jgi:hypothetical protein
LPIFESLSNYILAYISTSPISIKDQLIPPRLSLGDLFDDDIQVGWVIDKIEVVAADGEDRGAVKGDQPLIVERVQ